MMEALLCHPQFSILLQVSSDSVPCLTFSSLCVKREVRDLILASRIADRDPGFKNYRFQGLMSTQLRPVPKYPLSLFRMDTRIFIFYFIYPLVFLNYYLKAYLKVVGLLCFISHIFSQFRNNLFKTECNKFIPCRMRVHAGISRSLSALIFF